MFKSPLKDVWDDFKAQVAPPGPKEVKETKDSISLREKNKQKNDEIYSLGSDNENYRNWYRALPYGFLFVSRSGERTKFFLPISPSNLNITTHFATNTVPTLYGTVEEHSEVRYYDIVIEGTTGIVPKYCEESDINYTDTSSSGRLSYNILEASPGLKGFAKKTVGAIANAYKKVSTFLDDPSKDTPNPEAFKGFQSGYVAFHNFYRFLLRYKKDAAGIPSKGSNTRDQSRPRRSHPLSFFSAKDNTQYDVAIQSFTLRRSVENPMLYYYSIVMRGYNLRTMDLKAIDNRDRNLSDLGLNGVKNSSIAGEMKDMSRDAKGIVGSLLGGINTFGQ